MIPGNGMVAAYLKSILYFSNHFLGFLSDIQEKHFMIEYPQLFLCPVTGVSNLAISEIRVITKSWEASKNVTPPPTLHLTNFVFVQNFPSREICHKLIHC